TMQQAMLFSFVILMPFILLSGITTPIENMPLALQYFTLLDPLRYAIDIIHRIYLEAAGLGSLVPELWPLAIIAAITLSAAAWMFGNRLGRRKPVAAPRHLPHKPSIRLVLSSPADVVIPPPSSEPRGRRHHPAPSR